MYQWSTRGTKIERCIKAGKDRFTVTCAISCNKIIYYTFIKNSSNAINFYDFLNGLRNELGRDNYQKYYYLLDNASIHRAKIIKEYCRIVNINLIYNAPYMPEFNPIERVFSVIKNDISKKDNTSLSKIKYNTIDAFDKITDTHLTNFYKKSLKFCRI